MNPPSIQEQKAAEARKMLVLLAAAAGGMMVLSGAIVVFVLASTDAGPEEGNWIAQEMVVPEPMPAAEVPAVEPTPIGDAERGYGRPEPLFGSGEDAHEQAEPSDPTQVPEVEVRTVEIPTVGGPVDKGSLPGRWGNPYAPIQLVVFNDFQCPYCSRVDATFEQLHERYGHQIELWFRDYPLPMHKDARGAHMATRCANDQGRFWAMHDQLFANQGALGFEDLLAHASQLGLDMNRFEPCLRDEHHGATIDAEIEAAKAAGVTGTPATFVNGTMVSGARPLESFIETIDATR